MDPIDAAASPPPYEAPPEYAELLLPPETLSLRGRFIYRGDEDTGLPLYELSHHLNSLKDSDKKVILQKLETTTRVDSYGCQRTKTRTRPLFELHHFSSPFDHLLAPDVSFWAESQTRRLALGDMVLQPSKGNALSRRPKYRFTRHKASQDRKSQFESEPALFVAQAAPRKKPNVAWEWSDGKGTLLAREVVTSAGDEDDAQKRCLVVTTEMDGRTRDALVAAWYMRIWVIRAESTVGRASYLDKCK